jgi:hypothetical protein
MCECVDWIHLAQKVKLSLCFDWAQRHEGVLGSRGKLHSFFDLSTRWRWVVSFTPRPLYPRVRVPGTHCIGGWVGPRAVLDAVVKRKIPSPRRESNPRTPIVQLVTQRYTDWAITVLAQEKEQWKVLVNTVMKQSWDLLIISFSKRFMLHGVILLI